MTKTMLRVSRALLFASCGMLLLFSPLHAQDSIDTHLRAIDQLSLDALRESQAAETAATINEIKAHANAVFRAVWGQSSGLSDDTQGAARMHGWKTRWQTTGAEFDEDHIERYGTAPPKVSDPRMLGIVGRGRHVRKQLQTMMETDAHQTHGPHIIASLNNVIGWMRLDDGVTKAELQPRIDLTYLWDAPSEFWNTTADSGWIYEVFAQATNILKTNYDGDVKTAQSHAAAMTTLLQKCRDGVDANRDGSVSPTMMEGGLVTAIQHARYSGWLE